MLHGVSCNLCLHASRLGLNDENVACNKFVSCNLQSGCLHDDICFITHRGGGSKLGHSMPGA